VISQPILPPSFNPKRNCLELIRVPGQHLEISVDPYLKLLYDEQEYFDKKHGAELRGVRLVGWSYLDRTMRSLLELAPDKPLEVRRVLRLSIMGAHATMDYREDFEKAKALYAKAHDFVGDCMVAIPL
jgi:hypothetical protein